MIGPAGFMAAPSNGDTYKRREVSPGVYQCGCCWERRKDQYGSGDVLVQCVFHQQATNASVSAFERERAAALALKDGAA